MIPYDKKKDISKIGKVPKGYSMALSTKLTELKLVNQIPQDIIFVTNLRRVTVTLKGGQVKINEVG
jgi:hypothetical protein